MQQGASSESNPLTTGQTGYNYVSNERYGNYLTTDVLSKSGKVALRQSGLDTTSSQSEAHFQTVVLKIDQFCLAAKFKY